MRLATVLLVAFACSAAFASDPGQPLDCSDWVFLQPGLSCTDVVPFPCLAPSGTPLRACGFSGAEDAFDNEGRQLITRLGETGVSLDCSGVTWSQSRLSIWTIDGSGVESLIAYMQERCSTPGSGSVDKFFDASSAAPRRAFDAVNGVLRIATGFHDYPAYSYNGSRVMAIHGFATMFDVLQTFTPQPAFGFRVPYMPEGMAGADHFDTYWGALEHPIDFTQAHPLQCAYPAAPPHVGDYLTVADTVPTPAPGQGIYYITAATSQGATRYGRKQTSGHLSGRDTALLPVCVRP